MKRGASATVPELAGNVLEQFGAEGIGGRMEAAAEARGERLAEEWESPGFREAPVTWLAENLGQALPTSVPSIAGGTAGALLAGPLGAMAGAALPGWLMGVGDIRGELEDAGMDEGAAMDALVLGGAVPYAAADILMPARIGGALAKGGAAQGLGPLLRGAVRGGAEETFAEGSQSLVSQGAAAIGTGAPIDVGRIKEEAIRGGAAGVFLGAGGDAVAGRLPERTAPPLLSRAIETAKGIAAGGTAAPTETGATPAERTEAPREAPTAPERSTDPWDTLPETSRTPEAIEGDLASPGPSVFERRDQELEGAIETIRGERGLPPEQGSIDPQSVRETIRSPGETIPPIREPDAVTPETPTWARERVVEEAPETIDPKRRQRSVFPGDDRKVETIYTVADADRLKASHTSDYAQRGAEEFPAEIQGRAYHGRRGRQAREHTEQIVSSFDVERALDPTSSVAEGPPVAAPAGIVVAGNGRLIAQQRLYETEAGAAELKQGVERRAAELGIDPARVASIAKPVLFRQIVDPKVDVTNIEELRALNESSDAPIGKTKDPLSEAKGKAVQFREARGALDHFASTADPDATIRSYMGTKAGKDFLGKLVEDAVITKGERARFADAATGAATEEGRQLIERMFYATALGDPDVIGRAPPAVLRKLDTSLPAIIRADRIGGGWEIGPLVREAVDLLSAARAGDMTIGDLVAQVDFDRRQPSEHAVDMAKFLESGKGSVRDAFRTYANRAEAFTRGGASDDLFGYAAPGAEESRGIFSKKAALAPRGDPATALRQMLGLAPQESSGMPKVRSPFGESSGEPMTVPASMPPSSQPRSGPRQVSTQSLPASSSSTQRPTTRPSREGPPSTFSLPIVKSPGGWDIVQQSSDVEELKRRAADLAQPYRDVIRRVQRDVPGAKLMSARVKGDERLFEKMGQRGNDPSIIGDYLGGRMSIDTLEDAEKAIAAIEELGWQRPPWGEVADDDFMWDNSRGGYRARHIQLVDPTGRLSVEFQLVPKEIAEQQKKSHKLYAIIRDESNPLDERKAAKAKLKQLLDTAWAKFVERTGVTDPNADSGGPPSGVHPLAPREQTPFDPATEPSLVTISEELTIAERELRHLRIKARGQPAADRVPDAEKEVARLEKEYEAEAERVREARGGGGILPLAPTAQLSEQLAGAGEFTEGTATEAPKAMTIVRDLQKALHQALQGVKVTEGKVRKRGIFGRALAQVDPRAQVVRSVSLSDVPALGHEYGHLMQKLLFGATAKGGIDNAQLATLPGAVRGELQDLAQGISDQSIGEGWAEFWRRYLDNPETLAAEAPNVLEHVEGLLESYPAVGNAWADARELWRLHRTASPQARVRSHISIGEGDPEALSISGKWMRFRTNVLDDLEAIRKIVQHVRPSLPLSGSGWRWDPVVVP